MLFCGVCCMATRHVRCKHLPIPHIVFICFLFSFSHTKSKKVISTLSDDEDVDTAPVIGDSEKVLEQMMELNASMHTLMYVCAMLHLVSRCVCFVHGESLLLLSS